MKLRSLCASLVLLAGLAAFAADAQPSAGPTPAGKAGTVPSATASPVSEAQLKGLKARAIGPAVMGGRISDIAFDPQNPRSYYVGFAMSGVWKTTNNGVTFAPIFDDMPAQSIGAIAVAPSNSDLVWVGTGEGNDRNSSGWGVGLFKSTDGGGKFEFAGLKDSRTIRHIVIHPTNPDIVYVAAGGSLWADGGERGVYKTTDGGKTWKAVLTAPAPNDAVTGASDLVMDPANPDVLYAALYARQRKPWAFLYGVNATKDGADVGGIFKSTDAGATWTKLTKGLPDKTGRIGLAVAKSKPGVVMAVIQSDAGGASDIDQNFSRQGGIFRSEDSGATWTRTNPLNPRAFYFSKLEIDPVNDQRVYDLGWIVYVSDDGGKTFREDLFGKVHVDVHAFAIQPASASTPKPAKDGEPAKAPLSQHVIVGNDGGLYQSFDAGKNWDFLNKIPAGQFYRIETDQSTPYRVAGGLQDNNNWAAANRTYSKDGLLNAHWINLGGGDGFYTVFDKENPDVIFAESQGGTVHRINLRTGEMKDTQPKSTEGSAGYRFHWNSPLIGSHHHKDTMYLGGNRVFKLTNQGENFEVISPDLSRNEQDKTVTIGSTAENYAVVYSLAESPLKAGHLFAGTDDGRLWATIDDGKVWTELTNSVPAEARGKWVARIEPSQFDAGTFYVVFTGYRGGDDSPYIYKTTQLGKVWTRVSGDLPANAHVAVVREDPVNASLLYAGTEFGLFVSVNGGQNWVKFGGLPPVRVDDLKIHSRETDLVIGTHGRSIYIFDDTRPLREFTPEIAAKPAHLFSVRPAHARHLLPDWVDFNGKGIFRGENPEEGALLTVWVKEFTGEKVEVSISNAAGQTVAKFSQPGVPGFNRFNWDLRLGKDAKVQYGGDDGTKFVAPGDYTAELTYKDLKVKQTIKVTVEPGLSPHGVYAR